VRGLPPSEGVGGERELLEAKVVVDDPGGVLVGDVLPEVACLSDLGHDR
jgi:hypothetical protein